MRFFTNLFLLILPAISMAQSKDSCSHTDKAVTPPDSIYSAVEEFADFQYGRLDLKDYINKYVRPPEEVFGSNINDRALLEVVINAQGCLENIKLKRTIPACKNCDREALRLVLAMPRWKPAIIKGRKVASYTTIAVPFKAP